jgi:hypothetical protein
MIVGYRSFGDTYPRLILSLINELIAFQVKNSIMVWKWIVIDSILGGIRNRRE